MAEDFFHLQSFLPFISWRSQPAMYAHQPVAILLDRAKSLDSVVQQIRAGATGVLYDGSALPLNANMRLMADVVNHCHAIGITVEGEASPVPDGDATASDVHEHEITRPEDAMRFVSETKVDALAVAVGTAHKHYRGVPRIDLELLRAVREQVEVPLGLRGGSGSGGERLRDAVANGTGKVNVYTDASVAAWQAVAACCSEPQARQSIDQIILGTRDT